MEGGNKVSISLESPIDVKSSDMLVPINNAQFAHNRQKYQGHCLPSSLRFELDGWAAGDTVYNFEADNDEYVTGNWKVKRRYLNNNPAYLFQYYYKQPNDLYDYVGNVCYNKVTQLVSCNNISAEDVSLSDAILTGTFRDISFSFTLLSETGTYNDTVTQKLNVSVSYNNTTATGILNVGETIDVGVLRIESTLQNNGIAALTLKDRTTTTQETSVQFRKPSKIINTCGAYKYNVAAYSATYKYNNSSRHVFDNSGDTISILSNGTVTINFSSGTCESAEIDNNGDFTFDLCVSPKLYCTLGMNIQIKKATDLVYTTETANKDTGIIFFKDTSVTEMTTESGPEIVAVAVYNKDDKYEKALDTFTPPVNAELTKEDITYMPDEYQHNESTCLFNKTWSDTRSDSAITLGTSTNNTVSKKVLIKDAGVYYAAAVSSLKNYYDQLPSYTPEDSGIDDYFSKS